MNIEQTDENIQKTIFEYSQENYSDLFDRFEANMEFKGRSINEWMTIIKIPTPQEDMSLQALEAYTVRIAKITDIILDNYSLARSNHVGLKSSLDRSYAAAKVFILEEIEQKNSIEPNPVKRIKKPTIDILEAMAYQKTRDLNLSVSIAEMFFVFWEAQYKKIKILNDRVTSLNILKNIDSRTNI